MTVVFLIGSSGKPSSQTSGPSSTGGAQSVGTVAPSSNSSSSISHDPPRIPLADFKKLYDDPAKRPLIIDLRPQDDLRSGTHQWCRVFPGR